MSVLNFRAEDILAFEDITGPNGDLQGFRVTLNDGSEEVCDRIDEISEFLAMVRSLKNPPLRAVSRVQEGVFQKTRRFVWSRIRKMFGLKPKESRPAGESPKKSAKE